MRKYVVHARKATNAADAMAKMQEWKQSIVALHPLHALLWMETLQCHKSSVSTRSSTSQLLAIPRHNISFGSRSFRVSAPRIWNSLTAQIRQCQTLATLRCHLKTHYFQSAFSAT